MGLDPSLPTAPRQAPAPGQLWLLTALAMLAFAANSLLCRQALKHTAIDPVSFTAVRLASGALALALLLRRRDRSGPAAAGSPAGDSAVNSPRAAAQGTGNWLSALALLAYALGFSLAYVGLSAATGALLLFAAVQATMVGHGLWRGERLGTAQAAGLALALGGLVAMLLPGLTAPPLLASALMLAAGMAWGVYSVRGKGQGDPLRVTAGNFARAAPLATGLGLALLPWARLDAPGLACALGSGVLASGIGYAIWYAALPGLKVTTAATVQLSVPAIAALGGVLWLAEPLTPRLLLAAGAILGGIALVVLRPKAR